MVLHTISSTFRLIWYKRREGFWTHMLLQVKPSPLRIYPHPTLSSHYANYTRNGSYKCIIVRFFSVDPISLLWVHLKKSTMNWNIYLNSSGNWICSLLISFPLKKKQCPQMHVIDARVWNTLATSIPRYQGTFLYTFELLV